MFTHGLLSAKTPQTYCGLNPKEVSTTSDLFKVTCPHCLRIMQVMNTLPSKDETPTVKRGRGRPSRHPYEPISR